MMSSSIINALITEGWQDPVTDERVKMPVASIVIEEGVGGSAAELVKGLGLGSSAVLVSDVMTYEALGWQVEKALCSLGKVETLTFPLGVKADSANAVRVLEAAKRADSVVAVGSGTINDLCKYASFQAGKPYLVFGTAPSMNGYCSANASITIEGYKHSLPCHLPCGVFLDLDVLASAPKRLIRSGLGDSLCRSTAQADWLLSHMLLKTPYSDVPFRWLSICEEVLFAQSGALVAGDKEVLRLLCQTLVLSGFGMVLAGGSYPASQGEHLIAHMMEMAGKPGEETPAYHGEQIAITTLTMAALQYRLLERKPVLRETPFPKREMVSLLGKVLAQESSDMFAQKKMGGRKVAAMNAYIECHWDRIVERVSAVMIPEARLLQVLQQAGALCHPWQIGWDAGRYGQAVRYASFMRNRYTFLDILRQSSGSF